MTAHDKQAWVALYVLSRANEEISALGGIAGSPLDTEAWIRRHFQRCPREFAYQDWSSYQPAMRKIRLLAESQGEHIESGDVRGEKL
jgi:hypothetical protein